MNKFETFLSKVGTEAKKVVSYIVNKALPVATTVAKDAEPLEDLILDKFFPGISTEFNLVVNAAAATEASYAVIEQGSGTGAQKFAAVLASVQSQLLPQLLAAGLDTATANAMIEKYVQAVITILNTFPVATSTTATAASSTTTASTSTVNTITATA